MCSPRPGVIDGQHREQNLMFERQQQCLDGFTDPQLSHHASNRIETYWYALGVVDEEQAKRLSEQAVQRAVQQVMNGLPEITPQDLTRRALEEVQHMLNEWLTAVSSSNPHSASACVRVALLDGVAPDWPTQLMIHSHQPETIHALTQTLPEPTPPYNKLEMPEQIINSYPLPNTASLLNGLLRRFGKMLKQWLHPVSKAE